MNIVPTPMENQNGISEGFGRPYYFRRCEESSTNIESLPDELVFEILLRLPAEDIYDNAKLVCWRWYRMVGARDFVHAHLAHHSTTGLLVHDYSSQKRLNNPLVFVAMRQGRIEVSELDYKMATNNFASCNGLIVAYHPSKVALRITNPATKQQFDLPPFIPQSLVSLCYSIAYSAVSMKYKVVHTYYDDDYYYDDEQSLRCTIATVGVDKSWRDVCTEHLSPETKNHLYISKNPIMTEGFLHWTDAQTHTHVLTLNVETETFTEYHFPDGQGYGGKRYYSSTGKSLSLVIGGKSYYSSTGKSLSLFIFGTNFSMEVWDMKPETGEWTKMYNIDLEAHKFKLEQLCSKESWGFPVRLLSAGWLKYQEVLVLRFTQLTRVCVAYNVLTQEFDLFELPSDTCSYKFIPHTKSLLWLT